MNKKILVWILAAMIATPSAAFAGVLRRQPANLGTARIGAQAATFVYDFNNGSVAASGNADWAMGLVIDTVPLKVTLYASSTASGAFARIVTSSTSGTTIAATAFQALPLNIGFHGLQFAPITDGEFVYIDAIMNSGASILGAEFNQ